MVWFRKFRPPVNTPRLFPKWNFTYKKFEKLVESPQCKSRIGLGTFLISKESTELFPNFFSNKNPRSKKTYSSSITLSMRLIRKTIISMIISIETVIKLNRVGTMRNTYTQFGFLQSPVPIFSSLETIELNDFIFRSRDRAERAIH